MNNGESKILNTTGYRMYSSSMNRAEGCYVYNESGNKYLDLEAGVWALPLGHCDPDVNAALHDQIDIMSHCGYKYSQPIVEICAEKLLEINNFEDGKCVFLSSGSEAVEYGVQLSKFIKSGKKCMCLKNQYFSAYGCSVPDKEKDWVFVEWNDRENKSIDEYKALLSNSIDFSEIGVFLFEPGNSSGLVKLPPANLIAALQFFCKMYNILIVVDEVTTGVGRTGKWFGYMHYPIYPDIVAAGKGLGNGYPVSAVIMNGMIAEKAIQYGFHYAQSHQNDPLGCRVAYEVLCKIENNQLLQHVMEQSVHFVEGYRELNEKIPVIAEIRCVGLLLCVELISDISADIMSMIEEHLFNKGIIVAVKPADRVIRTYCPLTVTKDMIDSYLLALESVLKDVTK